MNSVSKQEKESLLGISFLIKNNTGKYEKVCPLETSCHTIVLLKICIKQQVAYTTLKRQKNLWIEDMFFFFFPTPSIKSLTGISGIQRRDKQITDLI